MRENINIIQLIGQYSLLVYVVLSHCYCGVSLHYFIKWFDSAPKVRGDLTPKLLFWRTASILVISLYESSTLLCSYCKCVPFLKVKICSIKDPSYSWPTSYFFIFFTLMGVHKQHSHYHPFSFMTHEWNRSFQIHFNLTWDENFIQYY